VASLIEAIEENAIEAGKVLYPFCDRLAKLYSLRRLLSLLTKFEKT
jgi:hypothetical protein